MAYLTERVSKQEMPVATGNNARVSGVSTQISNPVEQSNLDISRQLKEKKVAVIKLLSDFPATAFWLLNKYQQANDSIDNQDEESALASDLATALNAIKKESVLAAEIFDDKGGGSAAFGRAKEKLSLLVQDFPFAFEDIVNVVDLLVYAYQIKKIGNDSEADLLDVKQMNLIDRRLAELQRPARKKSVILPQFFDAIASKDMAPLLLFLPAGHMGQQLAELVKCEQVWLSARQQLANANNKLVLFIANQYKSSFLDFDDLVQEGQAGLLKAVDRFDYRLGFQFSTYAGYWIRQAISRALSRSERVVRVPCGQVAVINKVYRAKEELMGKNGKEPTVMEIAQYVGMSINDVNVILSISQTAVSLDVSDDEENAFSPIDFLEQQVFTHAFNAIADSDLGLLLNKAITNLNPREAKVICSHFGMICDKEMTLQEIGVELNLTRERVRQIQVCALNKMKLEYGQDLASFL